ncbi:SlyX family protein [Ovoidimarina sediminis]|uniref:SlyX family protein n=1 Tax=Ovoidimarina sediminis TaxID=3079856 RepID=UPI0029102CFA|nr:SlyX family protein [Rhodophyticola sp. MJ-SS7]MDU8943315.1 SlyX family protein [Rhodophyticola sp. MJ-SS7]
MKPDLVRLEERLAHLERAVDDLSEVVAMQDREIRRLTALARQLAAREAEREAGGEGAVFRDERPPHW